MLSVFDCVDAGCQTHIVKVRNSSSQQLQFAKLERAYMWGIKPIISMHPAHLVETAIDESSNYGDTARLVAESSETEYTFAPQGFAANCAFLANHWSDNFFHWMSECLPRVAYLEAMNFGGMYIIPKKIRFIVESMVAMGVSQARMAVYQPDTIAKNLVVFEKTPFTALQHHSDAFFYVRAKMRAASHGSYGGKRIYCHREHTRRVLNLEAVCEVCAQYGFTFLDFEKLTFFEQVAAVANAEILVGPHGAGMLHAWFMPKNATVIEFFSPEYVNYTMLPFIKFININYIPLVEYRNSDKLPIDLYGAERGCKADMTVPVEMLDAILRNTIKNRVDRSDNS